MLNAVGNHDQHALFGYAGKFSGWSHTVMSAVGDAQFANYLADAGVEVSLVASPIGAQYAHRAGVAVGKVIGYCQNYVGVQMGS